MQVTSITSHTRGLWAVVPVKLLARSKQRLIPLLSRDEREALACAMLHDVLAALTQAPSLAGVVVITGDPRAAEIARDASAFVLPDTENTGTAAAVAAAARHLAQRECAGMLVVPADVPLITAGDIEAIVEAHRAGPSITIVPAAADGGTNALACSPPEIIPFCFGDDSFRLHREAAHACGIESQMIERARVAQDLDRPDDIAVFLEQPSATRSYACLTAYGIAQRLKLERVSL
jgi:2-phospho-L-lactate guanylyltransferase